MKHLSTYFLIFFYSHLCLAQPSYAKIMLNYGQNVNPDFLIPTRDNGALTIGSAYASNVISKLDSTGDIKWTRTYNFDPSNSNSNFIHGIKNHDSTSTLVGVIYSGNSLLNAYTFCLKLKSNGDTLWCRKLTHSNFASLIPYSVSETNDSGFVICGRAGGSTVQSFIAKLSKAGVLMWMKILDVPSLSNTGYAIKQTQDSGYVMTGQIQNSGGTDQYIFCAKLDKQGNLNWHKKYSESISQNNSSGYDITIETDGYLMLVSPNSSIMSLVKIDFSGNVLWAKQYYPFPIPIQDQSQSPGRPLNLQKTSRHGRLITHNSQDYDGVTALLDTLGNFRWSSYMDLSIMDMVQLRNKSFLLVGTPQIVVKASSPSFGSPGIIITDSLGMCSYTCYSTRDLTTSGFTLSTSSITSGLTAGGVLSAMHPTLGVLSFSTISGCVLLEGGIEKYSLENMHIFPDPSDGRITVQSDFLNQVLQFEVHDISGRTLVLRPLESATEKEELDLQNLPTGVYFYSISLKNGLTKNGKLIISK